MAADGIGPALTGLLKGSLRYRLGIPILGHILRVCVRKQGVGLDFVRERGYGRRRWLKNPAQAQH